MDGWSGRRPKVLNSAIWMVILDRSCPELTQFKDVRRVVMVSVLREDQRGDPEIFQVADITIGYNPGFGPESIGI